MVGDVAGQLGPLGEGLVFILGPPRSGTTLLASLLAGHGDIVAPPEPWIMLALESLGRVPSRHPADARVLGSAVADFARQCQRSGMEPAMIRAARAAAVTLYDDAMAKGGARWFVDKTPRHLLIIDFLVAVFPRARHLVVIRNPLDIAASRWSSWGQNIAHVLAHDLDDPAVFDTVLAYPILARHLARHLARSDIQVMPVHYENLARDPVGKLREVFTFIGAPADDATVNGCLDLSATIHARGGFGDHKIKETRAPHRESIGRWRTTLQPAWKRTILDAVGVEMMTFLGYGDAVEALRAEGIEGGDPATVDAYRHRAMAMLRRRWDDVRVSTTFEPGT